jgi:cation:H+ antiporter
MFIAGLAFLIAGAEALVRGASRLATAVGISPLVVGLTVVAFGTSSPEFAVTIKSSLSEQPGIAVGNIVGSNIFNVLLILGVSALITPLVVSRQLVRLDVPLMILVSVLVLVFAFNGNVSRLEGGVLFAGLAVYLLVLIRLGLKEGAAPGGAGQAGGSHRHWVNLMLVVGGLVLLVLGSRWLVDSTVVIARRLGVSEMIVGLTIIAAGTSLPEVVTSIIASLRGERDIAVGNVIGSNLFNLLGVLGLAGLLVPAGIDISPQAVRFDIPVMVAVALACLPIFFTGHLIARWEGALFFGYYLAYTLYLVLGATGHAGLPAFSAAMMYFVLPLTAVTLAVLAVRAFGRQKHTL